MADLVTLQLAHLPRPHEVHVALYRHVTNAAFLRQQLLSGNTDFEYALIEANVILSTTHVLAAVFRAANDYFNDRLKSRNIHSEIVFSLSPNNNIAESFRRFGITDTTCNLLAIKFCTSPGSMHDSVRQHLIDVIQGEMIEFSDSSLIEMTDMTRVKKIYKLSAAPRVLKRTKDTLPEDMKDVMMNKADHVEERTELEVNILGAMALRGAA